MESNRDGYGLTRHQQHVIAHVVGCELLGVANMKGEVLFALDIPFIWSIAADGSMDLGSSPDMASRLELDEDESDNLAKEVQELREGNDDGVLFSRLPEGSIIKEVTSQIIAESQIETLIMCENGLIVIRDEDGMAGFIRNKVYLAVQDSKSTNS